MEKFSSRLVHVGLDAQDWLLILYLCKWAQIAVPEWLFVVVWGVVGVRIIIDLGQLVVFRDMVRLRGR